MWEIEIYSSNKYIHTRENNKQQHEQHCCDHVLCTYNFAAFERVALKIGIRSATTHSQFQSLLAFVIKWQ